MVIPDAPELTVREVPMRNANPPMRVVLDGRLRIPLKARILKDDAKTLVITTSRQDKLKTEALRERGVEVVKVKAIKGKVELREALRELGERGVVDLMVEGGAAVNASFVEQGLADRLRLFVAPRVFGGSEAPAWMGGRGVDRPEQSFDFTWSKPKMVGADLLLEAVRERG